MGLTPTIPSSFAHTNSVWTKFRALASDIKLHHSVFALPWAILATVLAASRTPGGLKLGQLGLIILCMVAARTVAMTANQPLDADIDAKNPRSAPPRNLPPADSRKSSSPAVWPPPPSSSSPPPPVSGLPIAIPGRWHYRCRCCCLSPPIHCSNTSLVYAILLGAGAWRWRRFVRRSPIKGTIDAPPLYMFAAVLLWTAGFDIIYALYQSTNSMCRTDYSQVPARIGIARALWIARITHALCLAFTILLAATTPELGGLFWIGVAIAAASAGDRTRAGNTDRSVKGRRRVFHRQRRNQRSPGHTRRYRRADAANRLVIGD